MRATLPTLRPAGRESTDWYGAFRFFLVSRERGHGPEASRGPRETARFHGEPSG